MLADFKVNRCTRRCHTLSRPLRDGEWYYSVVIEQGDDLVRRDYSAEAWSEPPAEALGWWKSRMPSAGARKLVLASDAVLIDLLRSLDDAKGHQPLRYLLALTLLRRRVVTLVERSDTHTFHTSGPSLLDQPTSPPSMRVRVLNDGSEIDVATCAITKRQTEQLQAALQELLYCEAVE